MKVKNLNQTLMEENARLEEENKKLKSDLHFARNMLDNVGAEYDSLQNVIEKLKETIKDHQLYEEKLEHRIIEFEELLHWE